MTPKQPAKKLPRARVMWATDNTITDLSVTSEFTARRTNIDRNPAVVIPCRSAKQARAIARFMSLTEEERVERVANEIGNKLFAQSGYSKSVAAEASEDVARAVLRTIFEG